MYKDLELHQIRLKMYVFSEFDDGQELNAKNMKMKELFE